MSAVWFVVGFVSCFLVLALAVLIGTSISRGTRAVDDNMAEPDNDGLACPNWDCDACTAELEASIDRHPANLRSVKDPATGREWWA